LAQPRIIRFVVFGPYQQADHVTASLNVLDYTRVGVHLLGWQKDPGLVHDYRSIPEDTSEKKGVV
jgi:hypothetical protein